MYAMNRNKIISVISGVKGTFYCRDLHAFSIKDVSLVIFNAVYVNMNSLLAAVVFNCQGRWGFNNIVANRQCYLRSHLSRADS